MEKEDIAKENVNVRKSKKIIDYFFITFLIFVIGSIFGFIIETISISLVLGELEIRKGLVYGPFVQVYGIGAVAYYILLEIIKTKDIKKVFIYSMIIGGAIEYICSFLLEVFIGKVSWDYSNDFINFNGRTSLEYMIIWGIIGILFLKLIYPLFKKMESIIYIKWVKVITIIIFIFMSFNIWVSSVSAIRQTEREQGIQAEGKLDKWLDIYYPDEMLNKIYHNRYDPENL